MPESPEVDLSTLEHAVSEKVKTFGCEVGKTEIQPVAFGLKALIIMFVMDEKRGSTDELEAQLATIPHINSVQCIDVRRAIG